MDANLTPSKLVELNLKNTYKSRPLDTTTKRMHTDWLLEFINTQAKDEQHQRTKWVGSIMKSSRKR